MDALQSECKKDVNIERRAGSSRREPSYGCIWQRAKQFPSRRRRNRTGREAIRWGVDIALIVVMVLCIASGLLISRHAVPALGFSTTTDGFWTGLHTTTADVTVVLVGIHVAMSWRWILSVGRGILKRTAS